MAQVPTQFLLRRFLHNVGPSTVHGRLAMRLEPPTVHDRIDDMNKHLKTLESQLRHEGKDPKEAVQDIENCKMFKDLRDIARGG
ncbi:hypothetical protein ACHAPT_008449 [Fusarium lateritium]